MVKIATVASPHSGSPAGLQFENEYANVISTNAVTEGDIVMFDLRAAANTTIGAASSAFTTVIQPVTAGLVKNFFGIATHDAAAAGDLRRGGILAERRGGRDGGPPPAQAARDAADRLRRPNRSSFCRHRTLADYCQVRSHLLLPMKCSAHFEP